MQRNYGQPFLELSPPDQYPEVQDLVREGFRKIDDFVYKNMCTIITNLLYRPSIAVSRDKKIIKEFRRDRGPRWYTYHYAVKAQNKLEEKGLISITKGRMARSWEEKGISSVVTAKSRLEDMLKGIIIKPFKVDASLHPNLTLDRIPITRGYLDNFLTVTEGKITKEDLIKAYFDVSKLNDEYFSDILLGFDPKGIVPISEMPFEVLREEQGKIERNEGIRMATNVFFTAMFSKNGDGRLYQRCKSFQNIPRGLRKYLLIDKNPTAELDYPGMHINLAYFLSGKENPYINDPYSPVIEKLGFLPFGELREAVKKCVIVGLNTPDMQTCFKAMRYHNRKDVKNLQKAGIELRDVYETFLKQNPAIREIYTSDLRKTHELMFLESNIIRKVLSNLSEEKIKALPLHDEIICEQKEESAVRQIMKDTYTNITGQNINVRKD